MGAALFSLALPPLPAHAQWQWGAAEVVAPAQTGVFHHLDASGRQALAVSGPHVALAWSDTGLARCHLALKQGEAPFRDLPFGQGECFDPSVAPLDASRFLLAWEDEGGVRVAVADARGVRPAVTLAPAGGHAVLRRHATLGIHVAWSATEGRWRRLWRSCLTRQGDLLYAEAPQPVDPTPPVDDQMYPALAVTPGAVHLAWEDRRHGHTVIYASHSRDGQTWSAPLRVSQNPTGKAAGGLGRGTGAMRPALAAFGPDLAVVWLDKRDFLSGYDVFGAVSRDQGSSRSPGRPKNDLAPVGGGSGAVPEPGAQWTFGKNAKLQDSFGDAIAQWHVAAAGNPGGALATAWDDDRDGSADIWLTWPQGEGYAENIAPPPAAGPAKQTDPALWLDEAGNLHLAWIERGDKETSSLRYSVGRPK
ncbi:MAG: exo-alpha-sialidase [Betaproteobacteria bacterium]|nr:exo-alpha-sialidase [Betaproteobacteria bacterium]